MSAAVQLFQTQTAHIIHIVVAQGFFQQRLTCRIDPFPDQHRPFTEINRRTVAGNGRNGANVKGCGIFISRNDA